MQDVRYRIERVDGFEEADTLRAMQRECFQDIIVYPEQEGTVWWIAYADHDAAGFCSVSPSLTYPGTGLYLSSAGVMPAHRGAGLQRRMIRVRTRYAKAVGMRWAVSDTVKNPHSANNLIACGFKSFFPDRPWTYEDAHYWRKDLGLPSPKKSA